MKGKFKAGTLVAALVGFVVFITFMSTIVPEVQTAGNQLNDSNLCAEAPTGCFYNSSRTTVCTETNTSVEDTVKCANFDSVPLSGLFAGDGIVLLIIMGAIVLGVIAYFWKRRK